MAIAPFLRNRDPVDLAAGVSSTVAISVDVLDSDAAVAPSSILVYIMGTLAYDGTMGFIAPFSGVVSSTNIDGYDGYHIFVFSATPFPISSWISARVYAEDTTALSIDETWQFYTAGKLVSLEQGSYEITMDAIFSGPMLLSTLLDASLYNLSGGAYVRYVEALPIGSAVPTGVRLWTEGFRGSDSFTLTVSSPPILDATGSQLASDGRTATISPFQSTAYFSNTVGRVRSWHESSIILKDSQRAYLAGIRGLDVFDIHHSIGTAIRWSQILDAYGLAAMCLSGSQDYVFSDSAPPFLAGRSPSAGATGIAQNTHVYFSIVDEDTTVEIPQIAIYLRNTAIPALKERVFSGANGWEHPDVCGGLITVEPQILNVHLIPKQLFNEGPVTVTVVATDLLGNLLSTSYSFTIGGLVVEVGFGTEAFGTDPFGVGA